MKFEEKLQLLRKQSGMSQENLAEKIGVSRQAVAKWETGKSQPELAKLVLLGDLFRVSLDRLIKDSEDEHCTFDINRGVNPWDARIVDFLCRAKRATYAGKGCETQSSRIKSHDLCYEEENLKYYDTYLGGECFAGEEALWLHENPIWAMNYVGRILGEGFDGDFLKECLYEVPREAPFRGPALYQKGDFTYYCKVNGDFDWYNGHEEIFCKGRRIYECLFHGGSVKK